MLGFGLCTNNYKLKRLAKWNHIIYSIFNAGSHRFYVGLCCDVLLF